MTNDGLVISRYVGISGEQRIYRWGIWGLSVVNGSMLHAYPFAREAAVIRFENLDTDSRWHLTYETPLTNDVEVFDTDTEADEFVMRAKEWFLANPVPASPLITREQRMARLRENFKSSFEENE